MDPALAAEILRVSNSPLYGLSRHVDSVSHAVVVLGGDAVKRLAITVALGRFTHITFCGVVRPDDHTLKPRDYRPLDAFWMKRGYARAEGLTTKFAWKDVDQPAETEKLMQFWMKAL